MTYTPEQIAAHIEQRAAAVGENSADVRILRQLVGVWQPIETAPHGVEVMVIKAGTHPFTGKPYIPITAYYEQHIWTDHMDRICDDYKPTHWMPLPTAPEGVDEFVDVQDIAYAQAARIAELTGERDRQYEQNAEFIVKIAKLEAALTEAVKWNWIDHEEGADDPHSLSRIPEGIAGPILALLIKDVNV